VVGADVKASNIATNLKVSAAPAMGPISVQNAGELAAKLLICGSKGNTINETW